MQDTIDVVEGRISPTNHDYLQQEFSSTEVVEAIKQMKSSVALGPNGLPALF